MPVTKTAKRALRVSRRKKEFNANVKTRLEIALRMASKKPTKDSVRKAISITDRAAKKNIIHKNKAARIKSNLSKLIKSKKLSKSKKQDKVSK